MSVRARSSLPYNVHVVADGTSTHGSISGTMTGVIGTLFWMAPEMLAQEQYGPAVDVYSYGIVLWEIAAQQLPWQEVRDCDLFASALIELLRSGRRPTVEEDWPQAYIS